MAYKVAINGLGRIGKNVLHICRENHDIEIVAINDPGGLETCAHMFKYDSVLGRYKGTVEVGDKALVVDGTPIPFYEMFDPAEIPWQDHGAQAVLECTGIFTDGDKARAHLRDGQVKKVVISAPGKGNLDGTFVIGVNHAEYDGAKHHVISNASCTTNCLAPVAKVIDDAFGLERGLMTTIHSYTNDQRVLDAPHKDLRRARAAAMNMIPTSTGAAKAVGLVLPHLNGKLDGMAVRVPTPNVSLVDLVVTTKENTDAAGVNDALKKAAEGSLKGILDFVTEPLVSSDFMGHPASSSVDADNTKVLGDNLIKVLSWYDNEWGYSNRLVELVIYALENDA